MRTKIFIFFFASYGYLLGLHLFKENRAEAAENYKRLSAATVMDREMVSYASKLDSIVEASRQRMQDCRPQVASQSFEQQVRCDDVLLETICDFNESISYKDARRLAALIERKADFYNVDPYLVAALVSQESAFCQEAISPVGALGLGQLMPETAADLGVDPMDSSENLDGCVRYLAQNLDAWAYTNDPIGLALASYNAGPGAVAMYGGVPPYEETQNYVSIIKYRYDQIRSRSVSFGGSSHSYG